MTPSPHTHDVGPLLAHFFVPGIPRPGGSKRAFARQIGGKLRAMVADSSGENGKAWRSSIVGIAADVWNAPLLDEPLIVRFVFTMPRPRSHYTKKGLRPNAPHFHTSKPDALKLARACEDALTSVLWRDDCLVVDGGQRKVYGERPGVEVAIWRALNTNTEQLTEARPAA